MIRGKLPIGADYFHKGVGRWQRKATYGWRRRAIVIMEGIVGHRINSRKWHVHHKDGDKTNDDPSNLELKRAGKHISDHNRGHKRSIGINNANAKANPKIVRRIRMLRKTTDLTEQEIGDRVGLSQPQVHRIIVGKAWSSVK